MPIEKISLSRSSRDQLLPNGIYWGKIEEVEVVEESPSGFPYLKLRIAANVEGERRAFWTNVSLAPTARFKVDELLDALEAPTEGEIRVQQLKGNSLFFKLAIDTYNGNQRNVIEKFLVPSQVRETQVLNRNSTPVSPFSSQMSSPFRPTPRRPRIEEMEPETEQDDEGE
jgi:hypothetical protein